MLAVIFLWKGSLWGAYLAFVKGVQKQRVKLTATKCSPQVPRLLGTWVIRVDFPPVELSGEQSSQPGKLGAVRPWVTGGPEKRSPAWAGSRSYRHPPGLEGPCKTNRRQMILLKPLEWQGISICLSLASLLFRIMQTGIWAGHASFIIFSLYQALQFFFL